MKLIEILQGKKCRVDYHDPFIPYLRISTIDLKSVALSKQNLSRYDCVVIATDHTRVDYKAVLDHARAIYDVRNVYKGITSNKITKI